MVIHYRTSIGDVLLDSEFNKTVPNGMIVTVSLLFTIKIVPILFGTFGKFKESIDNKIITYKNLHNSSWTRKYPVISLFTIKLTGRVKITVRSESFIF